MTPNLVHRVRVFSGEQRPKTCRHKHRLQNTGGIFYQSVGLMQCAKCRGWQEIRKGVK